MCWTYSPRCRLNHGLDVRQLCSSAGDTATCNPLIRLYNANLPGIWNAARIWRGDAKSCVSRLADADGRAWQLWIEKRD